MLGRWLQMASSFLPYLKTNKKNNPNKKIPHASVNQNIFLKVMLTPHMFLLSKDMGRYN